MIVSYKFVVAVSPVWGSCQKIWWPAEPGSTCVTNVERILILILM